MALIYRGTVKSLEDQVNQHRNTINQKYREILGDEYYEKLSRRTHQLFVPACFLNTVEELNKQVGLTFAPDTCSKLIPLVDTVSLDKSGRVKEKSARISYAFYINDDSFRNSGSYHFTDKIIASYIHEFDHCAYGLLQNPPLYLLRALED